MEANVNTFLANFDGGARPNRYMVTLGNRTFDGAKMADATSTTTTGNTGQVANNGLKFSFLCKATSIPASNLSPCVVSYMGREVKVAGDRTFDDWSVTVYNNSDFDLRKYFESWSNAMLNNLKNVTTFSDESEYKQDATVQQLGRNNDVLATYNIIGIFPTTVSDISLAYDNNNTVEEFTVTFSVSYWSHAGTTT